MIVLGLILLILGILLNIGILWTIGWCGIVSFVLLKLLDLVMGLRVDRDMEREGLDLALHGESVA